MHGSLAQPGLGAERDFEQCASLASATTLDRYSDHASHARYLRCRLTAGVGHHRESFARRDDARACHQPAGAHLALLRLGLASRDAVETVRNVLAL